MKRETQNLWLRLRRSRIARQALALGSLLLSAGLGTSFAGGQAYTVLYSFQCGADGDKPLGEMVRDSANNLYGTTGAGGAFGWGTVFEIASGGQETVLHSFANDASDGGTPLAGLIRDVAGNLYGTTTGGGGYGYGTAFEISPSGTESVLYNFGSKAADGEYPEAGLILDAKGNLYGTTSAGGVYNSGTVFELSPAGAETVLHSFEFNSVTDGNTPVAGLVRDPAGNLYGTTEFGGAFDGGTVFKVTSKGNEGVLYNFCAQTNCADGASPVASLKRDSAGNLYGTTLNGGNGGTIFKLTPTGAESTLFSFNPFGATTGYDPVASVIEDGKGTLYGTTELGGIDENGVVFKLNTQGQETLFHRFTGPPDGSEPVAGLVVDSAGNLYGTTSLGGTEGCGTAFKITR